MFAPPGRRIMRQYNKLIRILCVCIFYGFECLRVHRPHIEWDVKDAFGIGFDKQFIFEMKLLFIHPSGLNLGQQLVGLSLASKLGKALIFMVALLSVSQRN